MELCSQQCGGDFLAVEKLHALFPGGGTVGQDMSDIQRLVYISNLL